MIFNEEHKLFLMNNYSKMGPKYCYEMLKVGDIKSITSFANRIGLKREKYDWISDFWPISPKSAYTLGFITGDGCIELRNNVPVQMFIGISKNDGDHLYNNCFNFTKWNIYYPKRQKNQQKQVKFAIHNKELCTKFVELGLHTKSKTFPIKLLSEIPEELQHYFLLGFFDADGSISYRNKSLQPTIKFAGPYDFDWSIIQKMIKHISPEIESYVSIYKHVIKNHKHSQLAIHKNIHCYKIYKYWYKNYHNDSIGLKRKHDKFLPLVNKMQNLNH